MNVALLELNEDGKLYVVKVVNLAGVPQRDSAIGIDIDGKSVVFSVKEIMYGEGGGVDAYVARIGSQTDFNRLWISQQVSTDNGL